MEQQGRDPVGRICPRGASYYEWQQGDTLESVARINGTTAQAIQIINPDVNFQTLPAGTDICLPSSVLTCISGQPYTIRAGDTFDSIAQAFGITTIELSERNPGVSSSNLSIGQVICVPSASGTTTPGGSGGITAPSQPPVQGGTGSGGTVIITPIQPSQPQLPTTPIQPGISCPVGYTAQRVQAGQTYADLLIDLNVSYKAMRTANPTLRPGYMVAGTAYCAPPAGSRESCSPTRSYKVRPGENLEMLAQRFGTTKGRLLMLNPTLLPTDFSDGTIICIP